LREYATALGCSISAVDQIFKAERMTLKKTFTYRESSEEKREHFRADSAGIPAEACAYLDESGIRTSLSRECGRGRRHQSMNVVAGEIGTEAGVSVLAPACYTDATTAILFETWFEMFLLPDLEVRSVIVMDDASFHSKKTLTEIAAFLSPYSPDFNPIEKLWANMKRCLRAFLSLFTNFEQAVYSYL
jgi:hypothetical protein